MLLLPLSHVVIESCPSGSRLCPYQFISLDSLCIYYAKSCNTGDQHREKS